MYNQIHQSVSALNIPANEHSKRTKEQKQKITELKTKQQNVIKEHEIIKNDMKKCNQELMNMKLGENQLERLITETKKEIFSTSQQIQEG